MEPRRRRGLRRRRGVLKRIPGRADDHLVPFGRSPRYAGVAVLAVAAVPLPAAALSTDALARPNHRHRAHRVQRPSHPGRRTSARCSGADTPATAAPPELMRAAVLCLINQQRTRRDLPPLRASALLTRSAQRWTNVMVSTGRFTHGPGNAFALRISRVGYNWRTAGENIASGYATPRAVVSAWMASTDHCRNVLNPLFRDVGTGVSIRPVLSVASGPATWTEDFGLLRGASPPSGNTRAMNGCPYR